MSSEIILSSGLSEAIPNNDSAITNQNECPAINESTQTGIDGTSVTTHAAVEISTEKSIQDALHPNEDTNFKESQHKNDKSKTSMNDSESSKELNDNNTEPNRVETNENEKSNEKCRTMASTDGNQNIEFKSKRIAKQFRVSSSNKIHKNMGGKVNKIFFGTVENPIPGKEEVWRILYDDGDVDIMSRTNILEAVRYYDINRKYDTNHTHKKPTSPLLDGHNTATGSTTNKRIKKIKAKATPPKKGKKIKAKVAKKEALPQWAGPPDEKIEGGWPKGWMKKVFARKNGASKGSTDRYWYSPKEEFKFRSLVQVRKFLKALAETKGDEKKAKETMLNY